MEGALTCVPAGLSISGRSGANVHFFQRNKTNEPKQTRSPARRHAADRGTRTRLKSRLFHFVQVQTFMCMFTKPVGDKSDGTPSPCVHSKTNVYALPSETTVQKNKDGQFSCLMFDL